MTRIPSEKSRSQEKKTVGRMIALYCRHHHQTASPVCEDCQALLAYAEKRITYCVFGPEKPVCSQCPVHCYRAGMREKIREVMRYSGPRMLLRHPVDAVRHLIHMRRPVPEPPARASGGDQPGPADIP
jgi:hypothetical protein